MIIAIYTNRIKEAFLPSASVPHGVAIANSSFCFARLAAYVAIAAGTGTPAAIAAAIILGALDAYLTYLTATYLID